MRVAFVLCGALAREVIDIARRHGWNVSFYGVDAQAHMRPERIAPLVERKLRELIPRCDRVVVIYGDCGTGGALDDVLRRYNVPRIAGPHCYEMYAGAVFDAMMDEEPGTFFLTDFLLQGFDGLVWKGLGLDRFPELKETYFANYRRVVYLAQRGDDGLASKARAVAERLGLPLEIRHTGYGALETRLVTLMDEIADERYRPRISHESLIINHQSSIMSHES
ncbi:MAG: DUF1638 domain-containing protein [Anaerolineae bacterium]|nr:DUF1638 domain-containing protein [Candidatus Roseilinea sp.]MDW8451136.1 DUF1638 domain-containing protein [Anaerolineae bacterium]